jgi:hypothetical protein
VAQRFRDDNWEQEVRNGVEEAAHRVSWLPDGGRFVSVELAGSFPNSTINVRIALVDPPREQEIAFRLWDDTGLPEFFDAHGGLEDPESAANVILTNVSEDAIRYYR